MKRLIITADEFGLSPGINRAINESVQRGVVTNTALIITGQHFTDAVLWCQQNPAIGTGIYLDLDEFFFVDREKETVKFYWGDTIPLGKIIHSVQEQIRQYLATGLPCDFVASKYNVHLLPELFPYICTLCRVNGIKSIRYIRKFYQTNYPELAPEWLDKFIADNSLITTEHFIKGWYFGNLDSYQDGTAELTTRPGNFPPEREEELRICTDPEVKQYINSSGIQLITYRNLS